MAAEEPQYDVLRSTDDYEIRRYSPYVVAETDVEGTFRAAGGKAFNILAAYIFGKNSASKKMAMTVPVESRPVGNTSRMEMTAPAGSGSGADDERRYTYSFVMESKYTLESLPKPTDARIRLRERPERTVAVHRFRGTWSHDNFARHERILLHALARDGITTLGAPLSARYNAPFMPSFLRRNEVMAVVDTGEDPVANDRTD